MLKEAIHTVFVRCQDGPPIGVEEGRYKREEGTEALPLRFGPVGSMALTCYRGEAQFEVYRNPDVPEAGVVIHVRSSVDVMRGNGQRYAQLSPGWWSVVELQGRL